MFVLLLGGLLFACDWVFLAAKVERKRPRLVVVDTLSFHGHSPQYRKDFREKC
jgi:hypothetical protein